MFVHITIQPGRNAEIESVDFSVRIYIQVALHHKPLKDGTASSSSTAPP